jgi:hypothetical protein
MALYCRRSRAWYVARVEGHAWRWVRVDGPGVAC